MYGNAPPGRTVYSWLTGLPSARHRVTPRWAYSAPRPKTSPAWEPLPGAIGGFDGWHGGDLWGFGQAEAASAVTSAGGAATTSTSPDLTQFAIQLAPQVIDVGTKLVGGAFEKDKTDKAKAKKKKRKKKKLPKMPQFQPSVAPKPAGPPVWALAAGAAGLVIVLVMVMGRRRDAAPAPVYAAPPPIYMPPPSYGGAR